MIELETLNYKTVYLDTYSKLESWDEDLLDYAFYKYKKLLDSKKEEVKNMLSIMNKEQKDEFQSFLDGYADFDDVKYFFKNKFKINFKLEFFYNWDTEKATLFRKANTTTLLSKLDLSFSNKNLKSKTFIPAINYLFLDSGDDELRKLFNNTLLKSVRSQFNNEVSLKNVKTIQDIEDGLAIIKYSDLTYKYLYSVGDLGLKDDLDCKIIYNLISQDSSEGVRRVVNNNPKLFEYIVYNQIDAKNILNSYSAGMGTIYISDYTSISSYRQQISMLLRERKYDLFALVSKEKTHWKRAISDKDFVDKTFNNSAIGEDLTYIDLTENYSSIFEYSDLLKIIYRIKKYDLNTIFKTDFNNWDILKNILSNKYLVIDQLQAAKYYYHFEYFDYLSVSDIDHFVKTNVKGIDIDDKN